MGEDGAGLTFIFASCVPCHSPACPTRETKDAVGCDCACACVAAPESEARHSSARTVARLSRRTPWSALAAPRRAPDAHPVGPGRSERSRCRRAAERLPPRREGSGGGAGRRGSRASSAARRLGGSAARRLGGSAARRLGGSAARRLGGSAARRLGGSAARRLGGSAARRLGGCAGQTPGSAARRLGGSAARRLGGSAARRLGGSAARRLGGSAARRLGGIVTTPSSAVVKSRGEHSMASRPPTRRRSASAMHSATEPIRRTIARLSLRIVVMAPLRKFFRPAVRRAPLAPEGIFAHPVSANRNARAAPMEPLRARGPFVYGAASLIVEPARRPADANGSRLVIGRGIPAGTAADYMRGDAATLCLASMPELRVVLPERGP